MSSRGPKVGRIATKPLRSQGVPNKGDKIKSGRISPASSWAQKWAELLHNPYGLGGPKTRGQNQKWLHNLYLLGDPKVMELGHNPYILRRLQKGGQSQKWPQYPDHL